jgi:succinate dehydrogenase/fumarate reductase flavoprotein subunit
MVALMITDGQISGALGMGTNNGKLYVFRAKTVVMSTGRANRLTPNVTGIWGNHRIPVNETGDGRAMACRAGLPVINMEFLSPGHYSIGNYELNLGSPRNTVQPAAAVTGPNGKVIVPRTRFYDWDNLIKEKVDPAITRQKMLSGSRSPRPSYVQLKQQGEGPFYLDLTGGTEEEVKYIEWSIGNEGKGSLFLDYLKKQEGFDFRKDKLEWLPNSREMAGTASSGLVVNNNLETEVKGLYGAGDDVGGVPWAGAPGAFVMGWLAGEKAAKEARQQKGFQPADAAQMESLKTRCSGILSSKDGQHWREVELAVQNVLDYYAGNVRAGNTLRRGIERLNDIKKNVQFKAENPHELMRCLEVQSIIDNAEMVLNASLERQESRRMPFGFIRADFPQQDDARWLAFLALKRCEGNIKFSRIPIKQ